MRLMSGTNAISHGRKNLHQKMISRFPSRVAQTGKLSRCGAWPMLPVLLCAVFCSVARARDVPWSERVANSTMGRVQTDASASVTITGTSGGVGLGGALYRDGTYAYYVGSSVVSNDPTGEPASTEMEPAPAATVARAETVLVDAWFNSQQRQNAAGHKEYFHYKWSDYSDSGFSLLGHIFTSQGATLGTLYEAPTRDRLKDAQFYIIVSPDNPAKNPHPHYVQPRDADQVAEWVKQGGVLVLMENDPANADIAHLDLLADRFGIHFDNVLKRHVIGNQFAPGYIPVSGGGPIFQNSHMLYMKDTCAISLKYPAKALLEDKAGIVMATAKYGRGTVVAIVDPWLYNEYTDHRNPLPRQDNYEAGKEFVSWLLKQAPSRGGAISQH
jgi:unsaturated rhamnogalacturonyl hydrolase